MVTAGVPSRMPEASMGGRSSKGTVFRFAVIFTRAGGPRRRDPSIRSGAGQPGRGASVPAFVNQVEATAEERGGERVGVGADLALVLAEGVACAPILKQVALAAITCRSGPAPASPGRPPVDRRRVLLPAEDEAGAGPRASCGSSR